MFPRRYFAARYTAPRYFPQSQGVVAAVQAGRLEYTAPKSIVSYTVSPGRVDYTVKR